MEKTLQARIAEDIFKRRGRSQFYRTSQGVYYLRSQAERSDLPKDVLSEHNTRHRLQRTTQHRILHIPTNCTKGSLPDITSEIARRGTYRFIDSDSSELSPVMTFLVVRFDGRLLSYSYSRFSMYYKYVSLRTIGFRRFVDEFDLDLFDDNDSGLLRCTSRTFTHYFNAAGITDVWLRPRFKRLRPLFDSATNVLAIGMLLEIDSRDLVCNLQRRLDVARAFWTHIESVGPGYDLWSRRLCEECL